MNRGGAGAIVLGAQHFVLLFVRVPDTHQPCVLRRTISAWGEYSDEESHHGYRSSQYGARTKEFNDSVRGNSDLIAVQGYVVVRLGVGHVFKCRILA